MKISIIPSERNKNQGHKNFSGIPYGYHIPHVVDEQNDVFFKYF